ncbi:MAG: hypothetical protein H7234_07765 [Herminiimonas sp.]|nr:hypothetical protein [Herminiimonas sp.]
MNKTPGYLAAGLLLGSLSLSCLAQSDLLDEPQMDAVSAGALSSFGFGNLLSVLNARNVNARDRAPSLVQLLSTAPRRSQGAAFGLPNVISTVSSDSVNVAALKPAAATESLRVIGPALAPATSGNSLRTAATPTISPTSMSSASSSIP